MIRHKAVKLQENINNNVSEGNRMFLKHSNGRLTRFQSRWGLKCRVTKVEGGDGDSAVVEESFKVVQEAPKDYAVKDDWNADEFGLFLQDGTEQSYFTSATCRLQEVKNKDDLFGMREC